MNQSNPDVEETRRVNEGGEQVVNLAEEIWAKYKDQDITILLASFILLIGRACYKKGFHIRQIMHLIEHSFNVEVVHQASKGVS